MASAQAARISSKDESDLEWYYGSDRDTAAASGDAFGVARLYAGTTQECTACSGWGYTGARRNRYSIPHEDYLELLGLMDEQKADAGSKGGSCKKCGGFGFIGKFKNHGKRVAASPMQGGSAPCTTCKGLVGRHACVECFGEGYILLDLVGYSHGVTAGGTGASEGSDVHLQRTARISRSINVCNVRLRGSRLVLASYYGELCHKYLSTRWGRIASVFHLTASGLALLKKHELGGAFASSANMVEIVKGTRNVGLESQRTAMLQAAHGQAVRLFAQVCCAWNGE